jgi:hypothetical protein
MKVYIRKEKNKEFNNTNLYAAYDGFNQLGIEIEYFSNVKDITNNNPEDIIVSGIGDVRYILDKLSKSYPTLEYPESICKHEYLGRRIWKDVLGSIMSNKEKLGIFIKPVEGGKLFTGTVVRDFKDFRACVGAQENTEVWCSDVVNFVSEYRCFIRYGEILDAKNYNGDCFISPNKEILTSIIRDYKDAPNAYTIDLGVTDKGETLLIEVNEGYSVGAYGLNSIKYAKLLATRWSQLTNTEDIFNW